MYDILIDDKSHKYILSFMAFNIKLLLEQNLCVLDSVKQVDLSEFRVYDETRCLKLLGCKKYDSIYNRIRYLIILKSDITYAKIKVDFYDPLPIEKKIDFA